MSRDLETLRLVHSLSLFTTQYCDVGTKVPKFDVNTTCFYSSDMESVSYDRFTTPEAEINHMGQKLLYDSGEKDFFIL